MRNWYYARHGRQSGPVGIEDLRLMLGTGGLDPEDLVWREGMDGWIPAGEVPELRTTPPPLPPSPQAPPLPMPGARSQGPAASSGDDPYQTPRWQPAPPAAPVQAAPGQARGPLDLGECLQQAFELTKRHFLLILVAVVTSVAISMAVEQAATSFESAIGYHPPAPHNLSEALEHPAHLFWVRLTLLLLDCFLQAGWIRLSLALIDGRPVAIGMLFSEGAKTLRLTLATLVFVISVTAGAMLFIVPGVFIAVRYGQFSYAMVDRNLGIIQSFAYSEAITRANMWRVLGMFGMSMLTVLAGVAALLLGIFFALPLAMMFQTAAYRWMSSNVAAPEPESPPEG